MMPLFRHYYATLSFHATMPCFSHARYRFRHDYAIIDIF